MKTFILSVVVLATMAACTPSKRADVVEDAVVTEEVNDTVINGDTVSVTSVSVDADSAVN